MLVLHNRTAGDEDLPAGRLLALLRREGYRPQYFDLHAALEDPARLPDADFVVVAGGDGSFRKVALQLKAPRPLALLPLGTANNIARSLGITGSPAEIIGSWDATQPARFDIGVARGPWGERRFVEGVGIGLFARLLSILERLETNPAHEGAAKTHRVASDLRSTTVLAHEMAPLAATAGLDGESLAGEFFLIEGLNIARVGAGIELATGADSGDGLLEVVFAPAGEREKLLETLANVARHREAPSLLPVRQVRRLELQVPACFVRIDDSVIEMKEPGVIEITLEEQPIEVLLPQGKAGREAES